MGKIVGHCTVGWQVNEAQMAGLTHGGAVTPVQRGDDASGHSRAQYSGGNHNDDYYETFTHLGFSMVRQRMCMQH